MEFSYNESRLYKKTILIINLIFLLYNFLSLYIDFNKIEKNYQFILYVITIFTKFLSISNNIRYEMAFINIIGKTFNTVEDFLSWKKDNELFKFTVALDACEIISHMLFLFLTNGHYFTIDHNYISYSISCFILNICAVLYVFFVILILIFFCTLYIPSYYKSKLFHNFNINETVDINKECCICFEKNTNPWINLKCNHDFHKICINQWLIRNRTCPICRVPI